MLLNAPEPNRIVLALRMRHIVAFARMHRLGRGTMTGRIGAQPRCPVADRLSARHGGHVAALSALAGAITSVRRTGSPLSSEPVDRSYECFDEAVAAMTRVVKDDEFAVRPLLV